MLSIQDAGKQILTGNPGKFYVFAGEEYGIKEKYLNSLKEHYKDFLEVPIASELFNMFGTKRLIPLTPKLYIIRYDDDFIAQLSDKFVKTLNSLNIVGTVVCIYEQPKQCNKCAKWLPDYTVSFDKVDSRFVLKYLKSDFPNLDEAFIKFAIKYRDDYKGAWNICNSLNHISVAFKMNEKELAHTFGRFDESTDSQIKIGIASRNFKYLIAVLENYTGDIDSIYYIILNTLLELDKISDNKYTQSDLRKYVSGWNKTNIYYMFMNTYDELNKLRSHSSYKVEDSLIYLFGLLQFAKIPPVESMLWK